MSKLSDHALIKLALDRTTETLESVTSRTYGFMRNMDVRFGPLSWQTIDSKYRWRTWTDDTKAMQSLVLENATANSKSDLSGNVAFSFQVVADFGPATIDSGPNSVGLPFVGKLPAQIVSSQLSPNASQPLVSRF